MKKIYWAIGIIIIIIIVLISLSLFTCIGCGTGFVFEVKGEGCSKINENKQDRYDINFTITDELLDTVVIEYGYPASGLKTGTLREFCQRYRDIENCNSVIVLYCMGR